jgi:hypothetical protein
MGRAADPSVSMGSNLSPAVAVRDLVKTYPRPEGGTFNAVDGIGRRSFGRARPLTTAERGWHERSTAARIDGSGCLSTTTRCPRSPAP